MKSLVTLKVFICDLLVEKFTRFFVYYIPDKHKSYVWPYIK